MKGLSITGSTVRAVLNELVEQNPPFGEVILEDGKIRSHMVITINGQDVVAIFSPIDPLSLESVLNFTNGR